MCIWHDYALMTGIQLELFLCTNIPCATSLYVVVLIYIYVFHWLVDIAGCILSKLCYGMLGYL